MLTSPAPVRSCGCTSGACALCAPAGGCPCHDLAHLLGREPSPTELVAVLPSLPPWPDRPPGVHEVQDPLAWRTRHGCAPPSRRPMATPSRRRVGRSRR